MLFMLLQTDLFAMDEGSIKFVCERVVSDPPLQKFVFELMRMRQSLYDIGLIGKYANGIGYGNVSIRAPDNKKQFLISGSATGGIASLEPRHFARVDEYSIRDNWLRCFGQIDASSESLTHAAIYETISKAGAVLHVHNKKMWLSLMKEFHFTSKEIAYGTPAMALEVERLVRDLIISKEKIFAMGGHESGVIAFGEDLEEASQILLSYFYKCQSK